MESKKVRFGPYSRTYLKSSDKIPERIKFIEDSENGFKSLWNQKTLSDFNVIAGQVDDLKIFKVHKIVLWIRSPVLAMLIEDCKENVLHISDDFSVGGVESFLQFMYTGKAQTEHVVELLLLSVKYKVEQLQNMAENIIIENLTKRNASEFLNIAEKCDSKKLRRAATMELMRNVNLKSSEAEKLKE